MRHACVAIQPITSRKFPTKQCLTFTFSHDRPVVQFSIRKVLACTKPIAAQNSTSRSIVPLTVINCGKIGWQNATLIILSNLHRCNLFDSHMEKKLRLEEANKQRYKCTCTLLHIGTETCFDRLAVLMATTDRASSSTDNTEIRLHAQSNFLRREFAKQ